MSLHTYDTLLNSCALFRTRAHSRASERIRPPLSRYVQSTDGVGTLLFNSTSSTKLKVHATHRDRFFTKQGYSMGDVTALVATETCLAVITPRNKETVWL